jgi:hypothetical protein
MSVSKKPLLDYKVDGTIAAAATVYVNVPVVKGMIGLQISWIDAISSAAITLELSSFPVEEATRDQAAGYVWGPSGVTITGPAASAAGTALVNVENVRQSRARLKIVGAATTSLIVYNGDHPQ